MNKPTTLNKIMKLILQGVIVLLIDAWIISVYLFDGRPDVHEVRDYRQQSEGAADMYDYQIANIIGWHSELTQTQWWALVLGGAAVIAVCIWYYYKWKDRYYPTPIPTPEL